MGTNSRLGTATRRGALCSKMQQSTNPIVDCLNHKETPFAAPPLTPSPTRSDSAGLWDLGAWLRRDHAFSTWPVVEFARKIWTAVPYAAIESREPLRGLSDAARVTELQP